MAGIIQNEDDALLGKALDIANVVSGAQPGSTGITPAKIIAHDFKLRGIPEKQGLAGAIAELKQGLKMFQQGHTILAIKKLNPVTAQVHFFTLDEEEQFDHWVQFFINKLRQAGCRVIFDSVTDPHIIRALQKAGVHLQQSDVPKFKLKGLL